MHEDKGRRTLTLKKGIKQRDSNRANRERRSYSVNVSWVNKSGSYSVNAIAPKKQTPKSPKKVKTKQPPQPKKKVVVKKPKGPSHTPPKERLPLEEAILELTKYWPQLFPEGQVRPMQVGLKKKLKKDRSERDLPISWVRVKECLGSIGNSLAYHELIVLGANRYNKDGEVIAVVNDKSVDFSQKKIERIKKLELNKKKIISD